MKELRRLGWDPFFAKAFELFNVREILPARVAVQHKGRYLVYSELGELQGKITGRLRYPANDTTDFPAVGDWVVVRARPEEGAATITDILPRRTKFSRKVAGTGTEEQIVAANIDKAFIVSGLDEDFNPRRIERYLVLTAESGAEPVIVLNKADLCNDLPDVLDEVDPGRRCAGAGDKRQAETRAWTNWLPASARGKRERCSDRPGSASQAS